MKTKTLILALLLLFLAACGAATPNPTRESSDSQAAAGEVITTDSGLQYIEIETGTGPAPMIGDLVQVHYTGTLEDGTEFDSSRGGDPFTFPLGQGRVIRGWDEGIALMQVGGKARLIIPPELGYGATGAGGVIPPNATLIFEVELVGIELPPTPVPPAPTPTMAPDEITTESGLRYRVLAAGTGPMPATGDVVQVGYLVTLADGTQVDDEGEPITFPLGRAPVPGWDEAVGLMQVGGTSFIVLPPEMTGDGSTLSFELELLAILPGSPDAPTAVDDADYVTTDSGLKYYDIVVGEGEMPADGDLVAVHYTGWLADGTKFDSSLDFDTPIEFVIGSGQPIPGWDEGVSTMRFGGKRQLVIPPDLAFGDAGAGDVIPPNATLILEVELLPTNSDQ